MKYLLSYILAFLEYDVSRIPKLAVYTQMAEYNITLAFEKSRKTLCRVISFVIRKMRKRLKVAKAETPKENYCGSGKKE